LGPYEYGTPERAGAISFADTGIQKPFSKQAANFPLIFLK
jgi:hypothetical protein